MRWPILDLFHMPQMHRHQKWDMEIRTANMPFLALANNILPDTCQTKATYKCDVARTRRRQHHALQQHVDQVLFYRRFETSSQE
jgi:hypothetical protein